MATRERHRGAGRPPRRRPSRARVAAIAGAAVCLALVALLLARPWPAGGPRGEGAPEVASPAAGGESAADDVGAPGAAEAPAPAAPDAAGVASQGARGPTRLAILADAELTGSDESAAGVRETWRVRMPVETVAASVICQYRDAGGYELAHAGYLDLLGRVWGCALRCPQGWAEVVIVDGRDEGEGSCEVTVERIGQHAVETGGA